MITQNKPKESGYNKLGLYLLVVLRIAIGWHLLYEGIDKVLSPNWSAAGYLRNATWILAPIFQWMAANDIALPIVDFLNMWGLVFIGLGLLLGLFARATALSGLGLLLLYYVSNPPLFGMSSAIAEGSYLIINKNVIEMIALLALAVFPTSQLIGIDRFIRVIRLKRTQSGQPKKGLEQPSDLSGLDISRRDLVKSFATLPVCAVFAGAVTQKRKGSHIDAISSATAIKVDEINLDDLKQVIPRGKIGDLEVSKVIIGGNPLKGHAHARDLRYVGKLMKAYNSPERILGTLQLAEHTGINTMWLSAAKLPEINQLKKSYGLKLQLFANVYPNDKDDSYIQQVDKNIENGAVSVTVCGTSVDYVVKRNKAEQIAKTVEYIQKQGVMAGLAGHSIHGLKACDDLGVQADYYLKSFHHDQYWSALADKDREDFSVDGTKHLDHNRFHDNIFCLYQEETIEWLQQLIKPFIAFKVFAGGAIAPESAFQYAFENGADFVVGGMLDFQVIENINIANEMLVKTKTRPRKWFG